MAKWKCRDPTIKTTSEAPSHFQVFFFILNSLFIIPINGILFFQFPSLVVVCLHFYMKASTEEKEFTCGNHPTFMLKSSFI